MSSAPATQEASYENQGLFYGFLICSSSPAKPYKF